MAENKKKIEIEVYGGRKITIISEPSWDQLFQMLKKLMKKLN